MEELLDEETGLILNRFDYASAWQVGAYIQSVAAERELPIGIEVSHGHTPVFLALMPGATPDNVDWVRRKRSVALRFHHSSLYMRLLCESKNVNFHPRYRLPESDYAASGGGVPIHIKGVGVAGAVAVSGLPDVEDHRLAVAALRSLM
ncbi:heme-degrading domain-containing protein [Devosia marina]|uniref:Heme-degrading domain-containing protein n=1 Tax=Devosia marina TaxID=2683198 RepID=A0A7X3K1T2_9HYPH|nr:heme-degrading domain-containing protein [Devosia marina]MVS97432.1 heme-degrading domain-containing protein [Devosia marina]